jgi:hypothetical protein
MKKFVIQRDTLAGEMILAAKKRLSFNSFFNGLIIDYDTTPLEGKLDRLEYEYNTLLFITESFKVRHNNVA